MAISAELQDDERLIASSLKDDADIPSLSSSFGRRLCDELALRRAGKSAFGRLPRWAKVAAVLALMASLEAAASWIMTAAKDEGTSVEDDFDETYAACTERAFAAELPEEGESMNTILALAAGASCIISGSTDRSCSTMALDESGTYELDSRVATACEAAPEEILDSRILTIGFGAALKSFRSDKPRGYTVIIR